MKSRQVVIISASLLSFLALAIGCSTAEIPEGTLLTVIYSTDSRGKLEGCGCSHNGGGITKRSAKIAAARVEDPAVVYCDAGNFMSGTPEVNASKGQLAVEVYNHMKASVVNISERELASGVESFREAKAKSQFEYVSANVKYNGARLVEPYVVKKVKEARVAFVGLCGSTAVMRTDSSMLPAGVTVEDPVVAAGNVIPSLLGKADLIIVLSTCGDEVDSALASAYPTLNAIIGGRSYRVNAKNPWVIGNTRVVRADRDGRSLGRLDFVFGTGNQIKSVVPEQISMETSDPSDESMLELVRRFVSSFVDNAKEGVRIVAAAADAQH